MVALFLASCSGENDDGNDGLKLKAGEGGSKAGDDLVVWPHGEVKKTRMW